MIEQQQRLVLGPYMEIYELVIPQDNLLRQIKELVGFSFIYDELLGKYYIEIGLVYDIYYKRISPTSVLSY